METAILWGGISPFQFYALPELEQAVMIAHYRERSLRKSMADKISHEVYQKDSAKKESKTAHPTYDPIAAFLGPGPVG